ncbi:MAG: hypothetical protein IPK53_20145 [bacterium]|nr:hypothetical protein [bacterium]
MKVVPKRATVKFNMSACVCFHLPKTLNNRIDAAALHNDAVGPAPDTPAANVSKIDLFDPHRGIRRKQQCSGRVGVANFSCVNLRTSRTGTVVHNTANNPEAQCRRDENFFIHTCLQ